MILTLIICNTNSKYKYEDGTLNFMFYKWIMNYCFSINYVDNISIQCMWNKVLLHDNIIIKRNRKYGC